jgi:hypothetical protein
VETTLPSTLFIPDTSHDAPRDIHATPKPVSHCSSRNLSGVARVHALFSGMEHDAQPSTSPDGSAQGLDLPFKKKQKRNKPTLSCEECVERKTKVSTCHHRCLDGCATRTAPGPWKNTMAESARSVIAPDQTAWRASSDNRHAGIPTLQT